MSIEEKLITIAENEQKVFNAGKKSQYDEFWDEFQWYGKRKVYYRAFYGVMDGQLLYGWNDSTYNPKYPIKCIPLYAQEIFYYCAILTNTKVEIEINGDGTITSTFGRCYKLETIPLLRLIGNHTYNNVFYMCKSLKNITVEGEITGSIDFKDSPLTIESLKSIITHLKNYKGTDKECAYTLTLGSASLALLEAEGATSPDNTTWETYINSIGWNLA